jgi:cyclase
MLSRNFRLQRVGDARWLNRNYNFSSIATSIDELVILDVSRGGCELDKFRRHVQDVTAGCFMPLALGGGIRDLARVRALMEFGADKVVVNTALHRAPDTVREIASVYGSQSIVGAIDFKRVGSTFTVFVEQGREAVSLGLAETIRRAIDAGVGEIYLNSMDQDGTGQGFCAEALDALVALASEVSVPLIMAGGAGNARHLLDMISHPRVDAVATANLFNFVGDGLPLARAKLIEAGVPMAHWQ